MPLHMAKEIFPMLTQSRQQLNAYLNVMRLLFTQGESMDQSGIKMVTAYGNTIGITITGSTQGHDKIMTGLTLWAMKHIHNKAQSLITLNNNTLHIHHSYVVTPNTHESEVLLNRALCKSPKDSLSAYLARLLDQEHLALTIENPGPKELLLTLVPKP
jgi:sulfatase maturation enzyme AslB (radical SAM superfamily)